MDEYLKTSGDQTRDTVQIETPEALDCVEEIAAAPGLNQLFNSPCDSSKALESPGMVVEGCGGQAGAFRTPSMPTACR